MKYYAAPCTSRTAIHIVLELIGIPASADPAFRKMCQFQRTNPKVEV